MRGAVALGLAAVALGACSSGGPAPKDGGLDGAPDGDAAAPDDARDAADRDDTAGPFDALTWETASLPPKAFDVTATLSLVVPPGSEAAWTTFPRTARFTLVWNPDKGRLLLSSGAAAPVSSPDDVVFKASDVVDVDVPYAASCGGLASIQMSDLSFAVDGAGALRGQASVNVRYVVGDEGWVTFGTAALAGTPDVTPPSITLPAGTVDPLAPLSFALSEVVPPSALASLVGTVVGDVVPLTPTFNPDLSAIEGFSKPDVMLRPGQDYRLDVRAAADFAGNALVLPTPATIATPPAAPLSPADGFESLTGTTFGGAGVLAGPPLAPLAGAKSLILNTGLGGGFGFLPYELGPSVMVRLALAPGATVVRFDYRLVAANEVVTSATFDGYVRIATVGQSVVSSQGGVLLGDGFARVTLPEDGDVWESGVRTYEQSLPADAAGDVTFEIAGVTSGCGPPPPSTALIIDNLRTQ